MKYKLIYTRTAIKDIEKLDSLVKKQVGNKILELQNEPIVKSCKLINSKIGMYRYRIGNYRIIFDIDNNKVIILRIGHRREIYR